MNRTVPTPGRLATCAAGGTVVAAWCGRGLDLGTGTWLATAALLTAAFLVLWSWVEGEL